MQCAFINFQRIKLLKEAYSEVEDIDLFIGMNFETPTDEGSLVGSTFLCIIADVFARVRFRDRYFYDNRNQSGSFTEQQLNEIRKTSMARLLCDNTDIVEVQPLVFRKIQEQ